MELKPICLIAVRAGSKGVPGKNLKNIGGKTLLVHGIHKVIKSKLFSHVIVSTEDKKIASLAKRSGADVPFIRPKKLATDAATTIDVILHANKKLNTRMKRKKLKPILPKHQSQPTQGQKHLLKLNSKLIQML